MTGIRVHELAKELDVPSKELLHRLKARGEFVKSASSMLDASLAQQVRDSFTRTPGRPLTTLDPITEPQPSATAPALPRPRRLTSADALPQLLTVAEAAEALRIRPATIRKWASRGYLQRIGSRGRAALYDRDELWQVKHLTRSRTNRPPLSGPVLYLPKKYHNRLITTAEAARLLDVAPSTIRSWVTRGHLTPAGRHRGHLFAVGDVLDTAQKHIDRS
ncbi:translation initiation factor IF-2 N-terminal domain-containing protein [Rhodococcus yananensis]|uniref:translation initiation factor IF-2 N-terminal domain-containing protein n=1 Tax=Rhodococcus yananensis TaxID=2879464 RepID=UPI003557CB8F